MDIRQELWAFFRAYMTAYFTDRDMAAMRDLLHPALRGFGTGTDEVALTDGIMMGLFERDLTTVPISIDYDVYNSSVQVLSDSIGIVAVQMNISAEIEGQPFEIKGLRLSLVLGRQSGSWQVVHKHISTPTIEHEEGESYPIIELERRNALLEERVAEKTRELVERNAALEQALAEVKHLSGLLPICASCKRVRDDAGYWQEVTDYLDEHSELQFTHGICPECLAKLYPDYVEAMAARDADAET